MSLTTPEIEHIQVIAIPDSEKKKQQESSQEKFPLAAEDNSQQSLQRDNPNYAFAQMKASEGFKKIQSYKPRNPQFTYQKLSQLNDVKLKVYKDSIYFGQIMNGQKNGKGILIFDNGRIYEGQLENGRKHGNGIEILGYNSYYDGQFVNGKPEGIGKFQWPNGEFYDGHWFNGLKHGSGVWNGAKGDTYMGEWKIGKADGYGVHVWLNGDRYEGEFRNCLKHGQGKEYFTNGDTYMGTYLNGKPEGCGEYNWKNGSSFKGMFKNGLRHGQGYWVKNRTQEGSDTYQGEYINDKKCGYGIYTWGNGNVYKGNFFDDFRHGYGEMYWNDGSYYKGIWDKGYQSGEGEICAMDGQQKHGIFEKNVLMEDIENDVDIRNKSPIIAKPQIRIRHYVSKKLDSSFQNQTQTNSSRPFTLIQGARPQTSKTRQHSFASGGWLEETTLTELQYKKNMNLLFKDIYEEYDDDKKLSRYIKRNQSTGKKSKPVNSSTQIQKESMNYLKQKFIPKGYRQSSVAGKVRSFKKSINIKKYETVSRQNLENQRDQSFTYF